MRRFVIIRPSLSAGRPGDVVTADQLHMTDDKLDEFVKIGYATEIHDADDLAEVEDVSVRDPGSLTVAQVLRYVEDHPESAADALAAERAGKNRSGIVDVLADDD